MTNPSVTSQDAVVAEIQIAAPPERVFQALIDPKQLVQWWNSEECKCKFWQIDPRLHGRWHYETETSSMTVNGVNEFKVGGEILEYDPPRKLVYTWIANWHQNPKAHTLVSWELAPSRGGTRIVVTHSGLADEEIARKDYTGGWLGVLKNFKTFIEK
jgi:uncharacterized protein YndB with AHSA1/START domain